MFHSKLCKSYKLRSSKDPTRKILNDGSARTCKVHTSFFRVGIPKVHMDWVVGISGSGIREIESASNASLQVKWEESEIWLRGGKPDVSQAFGMIREKLNKIASVGVEGSWDCCNGGHNAEGCAEAVEEGDQFPDKVFALDCEMVLTAKGKMKVSREVQGQKSQKELKEVAKVTLLNYAGETCYESLVKPSHKVVDYRTQYSGITEDSLEGVQTRLSDVQKSLRSLVSVDDILIGHSINHDLRCLQLKHKKVQNCDFFNIEFFRSARTSWNTFVRPSVRSPAPKIWINCTALYMLHRPI